MTCPLRWSDATLAVLSSFVLACGGDGPTSTEEELPPPGQPLSAERRAEAMQEVGEEVESALAGDDDPRAELEQVARNAVDIPEVLAAVVNKRALSATVVLRGGMKLLVINNRLTETGGPGANAASVRRRASEAEAGEPSEAAAEAGAKLPGSSEAVVCTWGGQGSEGTRREVQALVEEAGYTISNLGCSLQDMRNYNDIGFLYLDTHGGTYQAGVIDKGVFEGTNPDDQRYALQTTTEVGPAEKVEFLQNNATAIQNKSILLATTDGGPPWKIAITHKFIANHWDLSDGLALIHACYFGSPRFRTSGPCFGECSADNIAEEFYKPDLSRQAVLQSARALLSFTDLTNARFARPSILYAVDRLLGTNQRSPERDPPLRPFNLAQVGDGLEEQGLDQFDRPKWTDKFGVLEIGGNVVQVVAFGDPANTMLVPSIKGMEVVDDAAKEDGKLTLKGDFGDEEGRVRVSENEVDVTSWQSEEIVARVPFEGPASSGEVTVEDPSGEIESNAVPLTEWRGTVTGSLTSCDARAQGQADARFRADIHPRRENLVEEAEWPETVFTYVSPASEASAQASGTTGNDCEPDATWTNAKEMEILTKEEVDQGAPTLGVSRSTFGGFAEIHPKPGNRRIRLCEQLKVAFESVRPDGQADPLIAPALIIVASETPQLSFLQPGLACIEPSLNSDGGFSGRTATWDEAARQRWTAEWSDFGTISLPEQF